MEKRGQSAVEFVILISALLLIIIPIFYLLVSSALNSGDQAGGALIEENARNHGPGAGDILSWKVQQGDNNPQHA
jgi:uncharacterized protein (UPF0333 family)